MRTLKERYLSTSTGKKFFPYDPHPDQIDIRDIAHGLSQLCRFAGQAPYFYSVAEHSILVASALPDRLKLHGLLHDASEAYLADLPRPLKVGLSDYKQVEESVEEVIANKFELMFPNPSQVKAADRELLRAEVYAFFGTERYQEDFGEPFVPNGRVFFFGLDPKTAEKKFLELYNQLL